MKILLDECVPRRLRHELPGHRVSTVSHQGWSGLPDGEVLARAAAGGFEVFVTTDRHLEYQQHVTALRFAIVVVVASSNRYRTILSGMPEVFAALSDIQPGTVTHVSV